MDDTKTGPGTIEYRCPGEAHPIDRSVHVVRLASFYPACLNCSHRRDTAGLTSRQLRAWHEVERRSSAGPRWTASGLEGSQWSDIDVEVARRFAAALASDIWRRAPHSVVPAVLVGSDGTWHTADHVPAICRTLELRGLRAVEVGAVTTAALAHGVTQAAASGAIWIGGASSDPHGLALRAWRGAIPASSPGSLDDLRAAYEGDSRREKRSGGRHDRLSIEPDYLQTLSGSYHGLRPLVVALETACGPLVRDWHSLTAETGCRLIVPERGRPLGELVPKQRAHFGLWIDGAGQRCLLVDERGVAIDSRRLLLALATHALRSQPGMTIALGDDLGDAVSAQLRGLGARTIFGGATSEEMARAMQTAGADFGADGAGHFWFGGAAAAPDALALVSLLLAVLSESDRPISEVVDAAALAK